MHVWNMLHAARWKYRMQKLCQKSPSVHHCTTLSGYISATKACIDNQKKNLLNSNISSICRRNMLNFGPLTAEICWRVWGTPANFDGLCVLASFCTDVAQRTSTKLCRMFGCLLRWYTIYTFWGLFPPNGILQAAKFTLCQSIPFSYIGSVTARQSSSGRQPEFAAWYKEWNYGTFTEGATYIRLGGHYVWHRPTF